MTLVEAYRTLGVDPATAERVAVTKRYRDLVKKLHPDVRPPGEHDRATADLQRVNEAFAAVRSSGFPAIAPPPPVAPQPERSGTPPPGRGQTPPPGNGYYAPPPPGNGYYAPPPPGNGYYAPPPPGNGRYAPPPGYGPYGSPGGYAPPPYGTPGAYGNPGASASPGAPGPTWRGPGFAGAAGFAGTPGSPFGAGPRSTVVPGAFGLARNFVGLDRFMGGSGRFYVIFLFFALMHAFTRLGGGAALLPLALSFAMWGASRRARSNCWRIVQLLWSAPDPNHVANLNRELSTSASVAGGTWLAAFALELFEMAMR